MFYQYRKSSTTARVIRVLAVFVFLYLVSANAVAQAWELRVCADPNNLPASNQEKQGFDNKITQIIADELGATLTYVWEPNDENLVRHYLRTGECDLLMGVGEGAMGLLNTVAYYQAPFVFVYRSDAAVSISSLNDEVLKNLKITTVPNSLPHKVLIDLGFIENLSLIPADRSLSGAASITPVIEAILNKDVDVGILYGPDVAYFAKDNPELTLVSVTPEILPPVIQMFRIATIGVRPGDEALRDRLNIALAQRWDDIQAVFEDYGIPVQQLPKPVVPKAPEIEPARVGIILPIPTGNPTITDIVAKAAQQGALVADDLVGRAAEDSARPLKIFLSSSPSPEATRRAALRMILTDKVFALVGGLEQEQTIVLSEVAEEHNVLFFNIGTASDALRNEACRKHTFHIEASAAMYLDALTAYFNQASEQRWFIVYENTDEGKARYERAVSAVEKTNGDIAGEAEVAPQQFVYNEIFDTLQNISPDIVLLLLNAQDQEFFLSQYESAGFEFPITGFPETIMQTRDFLFRLRQVAPETAKYRLSLWETTLTENGAEELNTRFTSRSGEPMDSSAWASYAAIKIAYEATLATASTESDALIEYLEHPETHFDVHKGEAVVFQPWNHQLSQPLYLLKINPDAKWGLPVSDRIKIADLAGELPALYLPDVDLNERLNQLGDGPDESTCQF